MPTLKRLDALNAAAALVALGLAVAVAARPAVAPVRRDEEAATFTARVRPEPLGGGRVGLRDATGALVELKRFERIASGSLVADGLLDALCERDRIAAFSAHAHDAAPYRYRFVDKPILPLDLDVEKLLSHKLDLFVFNGVSQLEKIEQLRRAGVTVFDLGEMRGLQTLEDHARAIGVLIGAPERGAEFAETFDRRMRAVAGGLPSERRRGAIYIGLHGDQLFGGGRGTSYDDVLRFAGLRNVAAERYEGWPRFTPEQVIALDPEVVVTQSGMREHLCEVFGLARISACQPQGRVVELPAALLVNPGVVMLEATERLRHAVYGAAFEPDTTHAEATR